MLDSPLDPAEPPSKEASMLKVVSSELQAKVGDFGTQVLGLAGQLDRHDPLAPPGDIEWLYRQAPAMRIVTGANEIQRNVIAQRGLGLPR
jgi:alkylation response protein AidB-like acyl-CoA dehydrogenase